MQLPLGGHVYLFQNALTGFVHTGIYKVIYSKSQTLHVTPKNSYKPVFSEIVFKLKNYLYCVRQHSQHIEINHNKCIHKEKGRKSAMLKYFCMQLGLNGVPYLHLV